MLYINHSVPTPTLVNQFDRLRERRSFIRSFRKEKNFSQKEKSFSLSFQKKEKTKIKIINLASAPFQNHNLLHIESIYCNRIKIFNNIDISISIYLAHSCQLYSLFTSCLNSCNSINNSLGSIISKMQAKISNFFQ